MDKKFLPLPNYLYREFNRFSMNTDRLILDLFVIVYKRNKLRLYE